MRVAPKIDPELETAEPKTAPANWAVPDRSICGAHPRNRIERAWKLVERTGRREAIGRLRTLRGRCKTPLGRAIGAVERIVVDHSFLRMLNPNRHEIAPGVWRSAQPSARQIRQAAALGIRTIVNLRGARDCASYIAEQTACAEHGIDLVDFPLQSRQPPKAERIQALRELFATAPHPILLHCKSGADRAGLASAIYLIDRQRAPAEQARRQLSLRYGHIAGSRTGVLGCFIDAYGAAAREQGIGFAEWLDRDYDPEALLGAFRADAVKAYIADKLLRRE